VICIKCKKESYAVTLSEALAAGWKMPCENSAMAKD